MGSEQHRFPQERRKRWPGCSGAFFCFRPQKGGKRIVPASRIPEANASTSQQNGPQSVGMANQAAAHATSFLAPPPSPVSFTDSAAPSTIQSPNNYLSLSANSPGGPSSAMYATGPYANDTQLVSPPVFSNYTTEPSTAPRTPPPELAHLTTPSSPDVPYAEFLSSSRGLKSPGKTKYRGSNDLQATYALYPGSPASSLRSPVSREATDYLASPYHEKENEFAHTWEPAQNGKFTRNASGLLYGASNADASQDSNFFCPATFAQFYVDQSDQAYSGGRISISREADAYSGGGNGHQNWHNMNNSKQDAEEGEAYRASFGFSADEVITTNQYVEISDVSFTMPFTADKLDREEPAKTFKVENTQSSLPHLPNLKHVKTEHDPELLQYSCNDFQDLKSQRKKGDVFASGTRGIHTAHEGEEEDIFSQMGAPRHNRNYHLGSCSDAEIEYSRGRSLRERKGDLLME
uniref:Uncharacterized protein n=2 Tax=Kalanchoe fedtschenkoi TaxID=63787 RepID=A0A7N0UH06_KALFE